MRNISKVLLCSSMLMVSSEILGGDKNIEHSIEIEEPPPIKKDKLITFKEAIVTSSHAKHIKKFLTSELVDVIFKNSDVPSVTIAQAIIESYWGRKPIGYNFFGIKGKGKVALTHEEINGERILIEKSFKKYTSLEQCVKNHNKILNQVYGVDKCCDYKRAIYLLQRGNKYKYATSSRYSKDIKIIIEKYKLNNLDTLL